MEAIPEISVPTSTGKAGVIAFFQRHPIVLLLLLSPGIPEYLSGSSAISAIVLNPGLFLLQIGANFGLYGPGVLLIREAKVRWHKGWATVLILGAAYGILEEGVALSTLFDPESKNAAVLGTYGHWLGVSWVWMSGVLFVHMIYSISIPILLVGLALPETREKSLLSNRRVVTAFAILGVDVFLLALFVANYLHFWMGDPIFVGSFVAMGCLVYIAYRAPAGWPSRKRSGPRRGLVFTFVVGLMSYVGILLIQALTGKSGYPILTLGLVLVWEYLLLRWVIGNLNFPGNERQLLAFVLGLLAPLFLGGLIVNFPLDLAVVEDGALLMFFRYLFRRYPELRPGTVSEGTQSSSSSLSATTSSGPRNFLFRTGGWMSGRASFTASLRDAGAFLAFLFP